MIIRKATITDMPAVHALVQELAEYEKAADAVETTPEIYARDFEAGIFDVCVAEKEGVIVGMALFFLCYSTWKGKMVYLDDFVVHNAYRRQGIGQLLFDAVLEEARRLNARLVKWEVLDWNEPALEFYRKNNAVIDTNWWDGKIYL